MIDNFLNVIKEFRLLLITISVLLAGGTYCLIEDNFYEEYVEQYVEETSDFIQEHFSKTVESEDNFYELYEKYPDLLR